MSQLSLSLLGGFEVRQDGELITNFAADKVRALLAYLAVERHRPHRREKMVGLLWPGYPERSARASLRQALYNLRKALGDTQTRIPFLNVQREVIQLNPECDFWVDVRCFEDLVGAEDSGRDRIVNLETVVGLYKGSFLEGFSLGDSPMFDNWVSIVGDRLQEQALAVMDELAEQYGKQGELEKAKQMLHQALSFGPWREERQRRLMELLAMTGQRTAALAQYADCRQALRTELGVEPSAKTVQLYERIQAGELGKVSVVGSSYRAVPRVGMESKLCHNLPIERTSFVGREREIRWVEKTLEEGRMVSLIGPGGVGKTRLALRVARAALDVYSDGVWVVDLASLSDPEGVVSMTARVLGLNIDSGPEAGEMLLEYCQKRHLLVVLDNCEHLVEACAKMADALLLGCPDVKVLATSREMLGVIGEAVYPLAPFPIPCTEFSLEQVSTCEAVRLFVERAVKIQPDFELTLKNLESVIDICTQLDGIPLAIELAAGWVRMLSLKEFDSRLRKSMNYLRGPSRAALPRQQTMRGCLDWSYDLLSEQERAVLEVLSVFVGGWSLKAAEAVCAGQCETQFEVLDLLDQLVIKSLVQVDHKTEFEIRYRLLEPVRQYALEKLQNSENLTATRDRHLEYYQDLAERAKPHLRAHRQIEWLRRLEVELPNIRQALDWAAREDGSLVCLEIGLRIAVDLHWFWHCRCRDAEGVQWLKRLLELEQSSRGELSRPTTMILTRAWALAIMVRLSESIAMEIDSDRYLSDSQDLFRQTGKSGQFGLTVAKYFQVRVLKNFDQQAVLLKDIYSEFEAAGKKLYMADCLQRMGIAAAYTGDMGLAAQYLEKLLPLCQEIGDRELSPLGWIQAGIAAYLHGDPDKARINLEEGRRILESVGNVLLSTCYFSYRNLGNLSWWMGDFEQAERDYQTAADFSQKRGLLHFICLIRLCCIAMSRGDYIEAKELMKNLLDSIQEKDHENAIAMVLRVCFELEWGTGNYPQAIQWLSELKKIVDTTVDVSNYHNNSIELGLAKVALSKGELIEAAKHIAAALTIQIKEPYYNDGLYEDRFAAVHLGAVLAQSQGQMKEVVQLLGSADKLYQQNRWTFPLFRRQLIDQTLAKTRARLDEETFESAWEDGKAMDLNQALAYALKVVGEIREVL